MKKFQNMKTLNARPKYQVVRVADSRLVAVAPTRRLAEREIAKRLAPPHRAPNGNYVPSQTGDFTIRPL